LFNLLRLKRLRGLLPQPVALRGLGHDRRLVLRGPPVTRALVPAALVLLGGLAGASAGCAARKVDPDLERRVFAVVEAIGSTAKCPGPRSEAQVARTDVEIRAAEAMIHSALLR
jgi:hypothetical protein